MSVGRVTRSRFRDFLGWFHFRPPDDDGPNEAELGYRLRKSAWGNGYATEGSRALIRKGFTKLGVQRVVAYTDTVHDACLYVFSWIPCLPTTATHSSGESQAAG